jgi:dihydroflavonol-4-reductase
VLEAAWRAAPDRLVYTSTESILVPRRARVAITEAAQPKLEDMIGPYCRSKLRAEQAVFRAARRGLPATVVSPTMPVGPGDRNLTPPGKMIRDFLRGKIPAYIHGTLNLVDVRDVAAGHLAAASSGEVGQRLLLAGHNLTVGDFLRHLATASGRPAPRLRLPYSVALGWSGAEHLWAALGGGPPRSSITGVRLCRRSLAFDGSRTWTQLGHQPRPLAETVADAVAWHDAELRAARGRARPRWPVRWLGSGDDAPP